MRTPDQPDQTSKGPEGPSFPPGLTGALIMFVLALIWVLLGFWKLLFIMVLTAIGYYVGYRYLRDRDALRKLIDKILPPGRFR